MKQLTLFGEVVDSDTDYHYPTWVDELHCVVMMTWKQRMQYERAHIKKEED